MIAAVLLDREARSVVLDADPSFGSLLEPFLKIVRIFKSLAYKGDDDRPFVEFRKDLRDTIGEEPHKLPSVFSFFLPEYESSGKVRVATHQKINLFSHINNLQDDPAAQGFLVPNVSC